MRKKIEELRNKEEGFTLVELLAVIVILGIIVAIAIPAVGSIIDRADSDAEEAEIELIKDAGRLYFTSEQPEDDNDVTTDELKQKGYLEPRGSEDDLPDGTVTRVATEGTGDDAVTTYTYTFTPSTPPGN